MQELERANRSLQDFLATTAHDLRNPLAAIMGSAQLLESDVGLLTDEQRATLLGGVRRSGQRLGRLVEDLFMMSTITAGEVDPRRLHVGLLSVVDQLGESLPDDDFEVGPVADVEVLVDPDHLHRMLVNYVSNATKYGRPPVVLTGAVVGSAVELRVRDHGTGVPEDFVARLFDHFARSPEVQALDGTGLGLAIVRGLATANGGDAWYEPAEPTGACFVASVPLAA